MIKFPNLLISVSLFAVLPCLALAAPVAAPAKPGSATASPASAPVTLRLKFKQGQELHYRVVVDQDGTVALGESAMELPMKLHLEQTMTQQVTSIRETDGAAIITMHLDSLELTLNGQKIPSPSRLTLPQDPNVTISPTGHVLAIDPGKAVSDDPQLKLLLPAISALLAKVTGILPERAVAIGDKWGEPFDLSVIGCKLDTAFALKGFTANGDAKTAEIGYQLKANGDTSKLATAYALPGALACRAKLSGRMRFDMDAGSITGQSGPFDASITFTPGKNAVSAMPLLPQGPIKILLHGSLKTERFDPVSIMPPHNDTKMD